jgi:hypothetical protein
VIRHGEGKLSDQGRKTRFFLDRQEKEEPKEGTQNKGTQDQAPRQSKAIEAHGAIRKTLIAFGMLTAVLVLKMSLLVKDSRGHHPFRTMPADEAGAIVAECLPTSAPTHCAAVLTELSFRESNNNKDALHDHDQSGHPRGCGAFGVLCSYPHATWAEQVHAAWTLIVESTQKCSEPLQWYASGSCTRGRSVARDYIDDARRIEREAGAVP